MWREEETVYCHKRLQTTLLASLLFAAANTLIMVTTTTSRNDEKEMYYEHQSDDALASTEISTSAASSNNGSDEQLDNPPQQQRSPRDQLLSVRSGSIGCALVSRFLSSQWQDGHDKLDWDNRALPSNICWMAKALTAIRIS